MNLDDVARGAGLLRHDRHVALGERVQQARLAGIGRTGDHDPQPVAQPLAAPLGEMARDRRAQSRDDGVGLEADIGDHVALVGEIESGLDQRLRAQQLVAPAFVERAQRTLRLGERLTALRLGLGLHEIGQAFDLGEIELAVLERAARELAGLGEPRAGEREHRVDHRADHGAAAMDVKLGHVLAGEARRRREPQHQAAVDRRLRRADVAQGGVTGRGHAAAQRLEHAARVRSGYADHGDGGTAGAAGRRHNRVV